MVVHPCRCWDSVRVSEAGDVHARTQGRMRHCYDGHARLVPRHLACAEPMAAHGDLAAQQNEKSTHGHGSSFLTRRGIEPNLQLSASTKMMGTVAQRARAVAVVQRSLAACAQYFRLRRHGQVISASVSRSSSRHGFLMVLSVHSGTATVAFGSEHAWRHVVGIRAGGRKSMEHACHF